MSIYLDNAATSFPKPLPVQEMVLAMLQTGHGTPGRGAHQYAAKASGSAAAVRKAIAKFFNVPDEYRVILTYSATDALNMAIKGFLSEGGTTSDHVIMSAMEHNSVSRPLFRLARDKKITLDIASCDSYGRIDTEGFTKLLRPETKLVVINHASNVTGTVQDIATLGKMVRANGSFMLVDAAQSAGHMDIDMQTMCIDMLATAGHKGLLATQGTGLLLLGERITHLRPFREGGTGFDSVSELQPVRWPEAFEAGTHNMLGIGAMGAALDFISAEGLEKIAEAERKNIQQLWDGLAEHENITLYGLPPSVAPCAPVISFTVHGWDVEDIGNILQQNHAISVRTGLQCAPLAHKTIGTFPEGTVRISPSYATTEEEINSFLKAIAAVAAVAVPY